MKTWRWNSVHSVWEPATLPANITVVVDDKGWFHYLGTLWCYSERQPY